MREVYMNELSPIDTHKSATSGLIMVSRDADPSTLELDHLTALVESATMAAIDGALHSGVDMPVGAAVSRDGELLAANYAQDNLTHNPRAHAEYMAMQLAQQKYPGVMPDAIGVTLEPCTMCQNYLAEFPSLKVVAFALPLASAALRRIVRPKECTVFERNAREPLPYTVLQIGNQRLTRIGELLLDATTRDIRTGATTIDTHRLRQGINGLL